MSHSKITDINQFEHFNAFFTRELKDGARPIAEGDNTIVSPVDGAISAFGDIVDNRLYQAKGRNYSLAELLGQDPDIGETFCRGSFMTIYLSPRDYHRIHMPVDGRLKTQTHVPGRLFSVAPHTVKTVPNLFARNERLVTQFETPAGSMALVLVGAINVSSIETVWGGTVTPPRGKKVTKTSYVEDKEIHIAKGLEMGRFNMGSTVILAFERKVRWQSHFTTGSKLQMGEALAGISATENQAVQKTSD